MLPDSKRLGVKYVVHLLLVLITVVAFMAWVVILPNWLITHSYALPANAPNGLTTERNGPIPWVIFVMGITRLLVLVACVARSANSYNRIFKHVLTCMACLGVVAEIAGLVIFIIEYNACNNAPDDDPSGSFNLCNDYRWCCVYAAQNMTATCSGGNVTIESSCPVLLAPCEPEVLPEDLSDNWVFDASFASTVIFLAINILHIAIGGWMGNGSEASSYGGEGLEDGTYFNDSGYDMDSKIEGSINQETRYENANRGEKKKVIKKL